MSEHGKRLPPVGRLTSTTKCDRRTMSEPKHTMTHAEAADLGRLAEWWRTESEIRGAEIDRLRAERDRLAALLVDADERAHLSHGVAELAMKHRDAAEAERDRLRADLDAATEQLAGKPLLSEVQDVLRQSVAGNVVGQQDEINRLRELLSRLEWINGRCLVCRRWWPAGYPVELKIASGHAADCPLAEALKGGGG